MSKPLVVQVITTLGGGGAEREVARVSPIINASGEFEVVVCCVMGRGCFADSVEEAGVEVVVLHEGKQFSPLMARNLARFLKERKPAIAHSHLLRWGSTVAKLACVPTAIMTEHGWSPPRGKVGVLFDRANIKFADRVVAVSEATRQIRISKWKTPADKVVTIPNAVDVDAIRVPIDIKAKKDDLGIPNDALLVGIVGRLLPIKGHEYFISAAAELAKTRPQCRFLVIGDGPNRESLQAHAKSLGLKEKLIFLGFRDDVREIIQLLDVACLSSISEGTPITILEAMACSKPTVVTDVGGCPEVVQNGVTGYVVPPRDPVALSKAIDQILSDSALAGQMGEAGLARVRSEYSVQTNLSRLIELYRSTMLRSNR